MKVITNSNQLDEFGRRVLPLLEQELGNWDTEGLGITLVQGESPHAIVTIIGDVGNLSFEIKSDEKYYGTTDAELRLQLIRFLNASLGHTPRKKKR
jgi:hypothetical protein